MLVLHSQNNLKKRIMNHTIIIIFGVTGDLARRQLLPALYHLITANTRQSCSIIGVAQQVPEPTALWQTTLPFLGEHEGEKIKELATETTLLAGDITDQTTYQKLAAILEVQAKRIGPSNRLIYCSTPAFLFDAITRGCADAKILSRQSQWEAPWHRIVYEKPFGHDQRSARELNSTIAQYLAEEQIFRIDHYLTKEIVSNIALLRFTNAIFEPLWNKQYIDQVQIIAAESLGVEGRGAYYDAYGAVRDVVQNHLLQLTALIGMEKPTKLSGDPMRDSRLEVLKALSCDDGIYGQYRGYLAEPQVTQNSKTETYALLKCAINTPRWSGVPFYLITGKLMARKETVIHLKFKRVESLLEQQRTSPANWLTIRVAPEAIFSLTLNGKDPAKPDGTMSIEMSYCHSCAFKLRSTQAYEQALREVLRGEQAASVRFDEIDASWHFIDAVERKNFPVYQYEPGTNGPQEVTEFAKKYGLSIKGLL